MPAFLTHACLGAPYGWSAVTSALTREQVFRCRRVAHLFAFKCTSHPFAQTQTCDQGVVVSAAGDWGLDLATYPMTIMIGQQVRNFNANPHKWDDKTLTTRGNVPFGFQRV